MERMGGNGRPAARRRLRVGVIDLIANRPIRTAYARLMYPNFASLMPQVVAAWAQELGHDVRYMTYTGREDLRRELSDRPDLLFVCAFTPAAYLAYAISTLFRKCGTVTVLGGPHARAYAADARQHFDYVAGMVDKSTIQDLLTGFAPQREGVAVSAGRPPRALPGVRERWTFIRHNVEKAPYLASIPMLGSLGCPYRCAFCIDSLVDYQPLPYEQIVDDLAFLRRALPRPVVAWHDPNFAVRFDDYMRVIEAAGEPGTFRFIAESSLSLLTDPHLKALRRHGFAGLIVGIESWFAFSDKTGWGRRVGADKVAAAAEHINRVARHIPYVQTNFVWGLDQDSGALPFELNKRFVDLAPAAFPSHSVFTAYGDSAPLSVQLARDGRLLDVPFSFLDTASLHNVLLQHHSAGEFYARLSDVVRYSYSPRATYRRMTSNAHSLRAFPRWMNAIRSITSRPRARYYAELSARFSSDREFRAFAAGDGAAPHALRQRVRREMGDFYPYLPPAVRAYLEAPAGGRCGAGTGPLTSASAAQ